MGHPPRAPCRKVRASQAYQTSLPPLAPDERPRDQATDLGNQLMSHLSPQHAWLALLFGIAACAEVASDTALQVRIDVDGSLQVPQQVDELVLGIAEGQEARNFELSRQADLPVLFLLEPASATARAREHVVTLTALHAGDLVLRRQVRVRFVESETRVLSIRLEPRCDAACARDFSLCSEQVVDADALPSYRKGREAAWLGCTAESDESPWDAATPSPLQTDGGIAAMLDADSELAGASDAGGTRSNEDAEGDTGSAPPVTCTAECTAPQASCVASDQRGCGTIAIEAGTFDMAGEPDASQEDQDLGAVPAQPQVSISAFAMDAYEVTVQRFRAFYEAGMPAPTDAVMYPGGRTLPQAGMVFEPDRRDAEDGCNWSVTASDREEHPLNCVDFRTALAFCVWDGGRLPTEAEWEYVARGRVTENLASGRKFPWGDDTSELGVDHHGNCNLAHIYGCQGLVANCCDGDDGAWTVRSGRFGTPDGLFALGGGLAEWTADSYEVYGSGECWTGEPRSDPLCEGAASSQRTVRGGSFTVRDLAHAHGASRFWLDEDARSYDVGFRCVR